MLIRRRSFSPSSRAGQHAPLNKHAHASEAKAAK